MDLKSVFLFLGLWTSIACQNCQYSIAPTNRYNEYNRHYSRSSYSNQNLCNVTIMCEDTEDIVDLYASHGSQHLQYCSSWNGRITFTNICQSEQGTLIRCSSCQNYISDLGKFLEIEIIDSACTSIPIFKDFSKLEVIRMHNTYLVDISITSHDLHKLTLLDLSQNSISNINTLELSSSSTLQVLNVSYNAIDTINDQVFRHIPSIKKLDLTSNRIYNISSKTFYGLHNLNILYLSHNEISDINSAFENLIELEEIYLDHNNLNEIKEQYFKDLKKLRVLKLNANSIMAFDWTTMDYMPLLKILDLSYNAINNVRENAFGNLDLEQIDLSFNNITRLVPNIFGNLSISFFRIQNNSLEAGLEFGMFKGMTLVNELDLSHQHIDAIGDYAFYGLSSLSKLLLIDNKIQNISKKAFSSLEKLEFLDLSFNMLQDIDFDKNQLIHLKQLRLNNNLIAYVEPINVGEMPNLEVFDLSENNLSTFNFDTFSPILPQLQRLDISHNSLNNIQEDIFYEAVKLILIDLSYNSNLTINFNLSERFPIQNNADKTQTSNLKDVSVSNCNIDNVTFLKVFEVVLYLVLTYNNLAKIEYGMFSSNKKLIRLDLRYNKISHIQPGSFKDNNDLKELNVAHNELLRIEYGSFLGLNKLEMLDISFNKIKTLKRGRFYETSSLNTLIADNNSIESIEYEDFVGANLSTLSIGGNPLACLNLINLKTETHSLQVTAINVELHLPNFQGVTCNPDSNQNDKIFNNMSKISDNNLYERQEIILEDIRNILLEIKRANYSKGSDSNQKSSILLEMSNLTNTLNKALYKVDEVSSKIIDNIKGLNNNFKLAEANANMYNLSQYIMKYINKSDDTDNKILQLITKIDENNNSKLAQAYTNMSTLVQKIIQNRDRSDEKDYNFLQQIAKIYENSKNNHFQNSEPKEIYDNKHNKDYFEAKNYAQNIENVDPDKAMAHFDHLKSNIGEPVQPNQAKTTLSDVCLVFITIILLCFMMYKVYELNLLSSLRRRRTASTQNINESIATATL